MATQTITMSNELVSEPTVHIRLAPLPPGGNKKNVTTVRVRNIKLDPTRALEPARKKLSAIESQRVMAVFEDTIRRVEIVTALPYIISNIDRFRVSLGAELSNLINQHIRIQDSYQDIRDQLDQILFKRAQQLEKIELKRVAKEEEEAKKREELEFEEDDDDDEQYAENEMQNNASGLNLLETSQEVSGDIHQMVKEDGDGEVRASSAHSRDSIMTDYEPRIKETMRNLGLVAQQVSHSCKSILRLFIINPAAMKVVTESCPREESGESILYNMQELKEILMNKLLTNPEEEDEKVAYLDEISKRERHNASVIEKLEKDLKAAIEDKEEEIKKNNEIIKKLQTELHTIEKISEENNRRTKLEAEKQEMADAKNSQQKSQKLQSEVNTLQSGLNSLVTEHRELEADLRAKKYKVENEVDNWIQKYDQDLGERQDEYEEIDAVYTEEKKQLLELEERFATLEKEYLSIMEERRVARSKLERAQRELEMMVKAATTIQAFWRSYKVRKALKAKAKKGGRKGGKKK
ncbi:dynein regulatory complex protein 10-like [Physella acuta]|uniref:dynein regulatory complex protein 10-like n=1 Tax=Physella acuta TaxID=109671 RepID=UPI0027DB62E3|nr:dynein regulatory complex protein 10-like [Physella acuta]XP_059149689.1 dynein regulatory complex protein 10-like [Physella acuta]